MMSQEVERKNIFEVFPAEFHNFEVIGGRVYHFGIPRSMQREYLDKFKILLNSIATGNFCFVVCMDAEFNGIKRVNQEHYFRDGQPQLKISLGDDLFLEGDSIILFTPVVGGNEGDLNDFCDIFQSLVSVYAGPGIIYRKRADIQLNLKSKKISYMGDVIHNYPLFTQSSIDIPLSLLQFDHEKRIKIHNGLRILRHALDEIDQGIRFAMYWMALEAICGDEENRRKFNHRIREIDKPLFKFYNSLRSKRNELFHDGIKPKFSFDDEFQMRMLIAFAIRWCSVAGL